MCVHGSGLDGGAVRCPPGGVGTAGYGQRKVRENLRRPQAQVDVPFAQDRDEVEDACILCQRAVGGSGVFFDRLRCDPAAEPWPEALGDATREAFLSLLVNLISVGYHPSPPGDST